MEVEELIVQTGALLLVLENTHTRAGGTVLSPELTAELARAAQRHGTYVHLDGARLFNAAVALGIPVRELAAPVNTVAVSLNKGLCAPMGTILAGRAQVIELAHRTLRRLGGASVHKAGIAAAAALVALDTLVERLADDHRRARELAALLSRFRGSRSSRPRSRRTSCSFTSAAPASTRTSSSGGSPSAACWAWCATRAASASSRIA